MPDARSCVVTKRPAGQSPFAGIARIRSLGVAAQLLRCRLLSHPAARPGLPGQFVRSSSLSRLADNYRLPGTDKPRRGTKVRFTQPEVPISSAAAGARRAEFLGC